MAAATRRYRHAGAMVHVAFLLAACTTHVTVDPFDMPEAHGARIPAAIGVYFPPGFSTHPVREVLVEDVESVSLETDIGPASRSVIESTLRSSFQELVIVDSANPEALNNGTIEAVATPRITRFDYEMYAGKATVIVEYELEFMHADGRTQSLVAVGREVDDPEKGVTIEFLGSAAPKKIAAAMRSAGTDLWFRFHAVAGDSDWFAGLIRLADAEREEMRGILAPEDGLCAVFVYLENLGYYDEYAAASRGAIVFAGTGRQRWLPDAGLYARYDLTPGRYTIHYGPAAIVQPLAARGSTAVQASTESIAVDCRAGRSLALGLRFWTGGTMRINEIPLRTAVGEIRSRSVVTDSGPADPTG